MAEAQAIKTQKLENDAMTTSISTPHKNIVVIWSDSINRKRVYLFLPEFWKGGREYFTRYHIIEKVIHHVLC